MAIKNADMGGDCDTVGSIAGQIAGALYGVEEGMLELYSEMPDFRLSRFESFLRDTSSSTKRNYDQYHYHYHLSYHFLKEQINNNTYNTSWIRINSWIMMTVFLFFLI